MIYFYSNLLENTSLEILPKKPIKLCRIDYCFCKKKKPYPEDNKKVAFSTRKSTYWNKNNAKCPFKSVLLPFTTVTSFSLQGVNYLLNIQLIYKSSENILYVAYKNSIILCIFCSIFFFVLIQYTPKRKQHASAFSRK